MRFTVLGAVRAWHEEAELRLGPPQQRAVLALLLASGGQPVSFADLVDLLWPGEPPASAANIVHRYVGALRRALEPGLPLRAPGRWLIGHAGGYRLAAGAGQVDLLRLRELAARARAAAAEGRPDQAVALFAESLGCCRGGCASDLAVAGRHPVFTAVDQECLALAGEAADAALAAGRADRVLPALRQAAGRDPLAEPLQARLMLALAAAGHQAEALMVYETARSLLAGELGIDPGAELREAHGRVLRQETAGRRRPGRPASAVRLAMEDPAPAVRPAQLPAELSGFTGRRDEVARLQALPPAGPAGSPEQAEQAALLIGAIDGMPGAGKTALAVHWAHRVAGRFPDGQLYVDLRGFDPSGALSPTEALHGFLAALGLPPQRIPAGLDSQAALYRSLLSGRRVLVLLDNARDAAQVRSLLPGSPGCMVIVTSRSRLTELVAARGARLLTLEVFSPADAREVLARRIGAGRVAAEPDAADEIITLAGRLPLALALVAARAAAYPDLPLAAIAAELRRAHGSLDAFSGEGRADVRTVFSWSYRMLSPAAARMFRLLSLHCGPDISLPAAASLAAVPERQARALLTELAQGRLLTEPAPGRFGLHDLLRSYAAELCGQAESAGDRHLAVARLLSHYLHSAHHSYLLFRPRAALAPLPPARPGVEPEEPASYAAALAWFVAERRVLEAAVRYAARKQVAGYAWRLACTMTPFYQRRGLWDDWLATARTALEAAIAGQDQPGQAHLHRVLAELGDLGLPPDQAG